MGVEIDSIFFVYIFLGEKKERIYLEFVETYVNMLLARREDQSKGYISPCFTKFCEFCFVVGSDLQFSLRRMKLITWINAIGKYNI